MTVQNDDSTAGGPLTVHGIARLVRPVFRVSVLEPGGTFQPVTSPFACLETFDEALMFAQQMLESFDNIGVNATYQVRQQLVYLN